MFLLLACQAIEGARFMQATEAHRLALTLHAGKCWGLDVLDTPDRLPSCVPGPAQPHAVADQLADRLLHMGEGADASRLLWLGLNAQRAGSVRAWDAGAALIGQALDQGLSGESLRAVRPWLLRPSASVHIDQWERAQIILQSKDAAAEAAWMLQEEALAGARPWTSEGLRAIPELPPGLADRFDAALALQARIEDRAAGE